MGINIFHAYPLSLNIFQFINILHLYLHIFWRFNDLYLILLIFQRLILWNLGFRNDLIIKKLIDPYNSLTHLIVIQIFWNQSIQLQITHLTRLVPNQSVASFLLLPTTKYILIILYRLFSLLILWWLLILINSLNLSIRFTDNSRWSSRPFIFNSSDFLSHLIPTFT